MAAIKRVPGGWHAARLPLRPLQFVNLTVPWNRIPDDVRGQIIDLALELPELSRREPAVRFTDERKYFVSEASVYRLLKAHDLITSPAYVVICPSSDNLRLIRLFAKRGSRFLSLGLDLFGGRTRQSALLLLHS